jgi:hypothetical protein
METTKAIYNKVNLVNTELAKMVAPENVQIDKSPSLPTQQKNIQPASNYIDGRLTALNESLDASEFARMLELEIKRIQEYADAQLKKLAEIAAQVAKNIASVFPDISIPPTITQAAELIEKIKENVIDRILASTINIELKKNLSAAKTIQRRERKLKKKQQKAEQKAEQKS